MLSRRLSGFVLFSLSVALCATLGHTEIRPMDSKLMDSVTVAGHWQALLVLVVLLINDAALFETVSFETVSIVMCATNTMMLLLLFAPWLPRLAANARAGVEVVWRNVSPAGAHGSGAGVQATDMQMTDMNAMTVVHPQYVANPMVHGAYAL